MKVDEQRDLPIWHRGWQLDDAVARTAARAERSAVDRRPHLAARPRREPSVAVLSGPKRAAAECNQREGARRCRRKLSSGNLRVHGVTPFAMSGDDVMVDVITRKDVLAERGEMTVRESPYAR